MTARSSVEDAPANVLPWARRCPRGHASVQPRAGPPEYYHCEACDTRYAGQPLDAREHEFPLPEEEIAARGLETPSSGPIVGAAVLPACKQANRPDRDWKEVPADSYPTGQPRFCAECFGLSETTQAAPNYDHTEHFDVFVRAVSRGVSVGSHAVHRPRQQDDSESNHSHSHE